MKPTLALHKIEKISPTLTKLTIGDDVDSFTVTLDDNQYAMLLRDLITKKAKVYGIARKMLPF